MKKEMEKAAAMKVKALRAMVWIKQHEQATMRVLTGMLFVWIVATSMLVVGCIF